MSHKPLSNLCGIPLISFHLVVVSHIPKFGLYLKVRLVISWLNFSVLAVLTVQIVLLSQNGGIYCVEYILLLNKATPIYL